jgi:hypothetical protein
MSDQQMFDLLVADAPAPGPEHVARMHRLARRARTRRRFAGVGAGLGVIAVCLTVAAAVALAPKPASDRVPAGSSSSASTGGVSPEAQAYATAIETLAEQVRGEGPPVGVLYVLDHTCTNVLTPANSTCDPTAIPPALRTAITTALTAYAPVTFVATGSEVTGPDLEVANGGVVVTLGPIQLTEVNALVPLSVRRGGLNGQGLTYALARHDQTWQVTGTVGVVWIS